MNIGEKIRDLRLKIGLTQEELAERSDLSKGFISQVEHGNTSPSVDTLEDIVHALGSNFSDFFREKKNENYVFTPEDAFTGVYDQFGFKIHWIVPNAQKNSMEPVIMELKPEGRTKTYNPFEGESFGYVLEGKVVLHLGDESYDLQKGDCFYHGMDSRTYIENLSGKSARVLWVMNPPNF